MPIEEEKIDFIKKNAHDQFLNLNNYIMAMDSNYKDSKDIQEIFKFVKNYYKEIIQDDFDNISLDAIGESEAEYIENILNINARKINKFIESKDDKTLYDILIGIEGNLIKIKSYINSLYEIKSLEDYRSNVEYILKNVVDNADKTQRKLNEANLINQDLQNRQIHEFYSMDSMNFNNIARFYEFLFYILAVFLILYFLGFHIGFDTEVVKFNFIHSVDGNLTPAFYIQKISILIIATTIGAFLLKRSFMNRRLADEAYRTAKELDALPRYLDGLPEEMQEKIRFDLAYKYFGQGIHHESYTGGENLMHENIKANTEFLKAIKGSGSDEESKKDGEK